MPSCLLAIQARLLSWLPERRLAEVLVPVPGGLSARRAAVSALALRQGWPTQLPPPKYTLLLLQNWQFLGRSFNLCMWSQQQYRS